VRSSPRTVLLGACAALLVAAGCAPREAYWRPAEGKAVGRDGLVGVRSRVPPEAADNDATVVAALSPLVRSERDGRRAEIGAVVEFRNKRAESIRFTPGNTLLSAGGDARGMAPVRVRRGGRSLEGPVEIGTWREAAFVLVFELPVEALEARSMTLLWAYRVGEREYPQSTRFRVAGPEFARRSISGDAAGLTGGSTYRSESGVPLLMDLPFLGFLFRGASSSSSRSTLQVGPGGSEAGGVAGEWWPLE